MKNVIFESARIKFSALANHRTFIMIKSSIALLKHYYCYIDDRCNTPKETMHNALPQIMLILVSFQNHPHEKGVGTGCGKGVFGGFMKK